MKNLRRSTERILEGNHEVLSEIVLPTEDDSGENEALAEHTPAPRSSKERAASAACRNRRLAGYEKVKKLHPRGTSMMAVCRALGMSRGAAGRYVHADSLSRSTAGIRLRRARSTLSNRTWSNAGRRAAASPCGRGGR